MISDRLGKSAIELHVVLYSGDGNKGTSSSFAYTDLCSVTFEDRCVAHLDATKKKRLRRPSP